MCRYFVRTLGQCFEFLIDTLTFCTFFRSNLQYILDKIRSTESILSLGDPECHMAPPTPAQRLIFRGIWHLVGRSLDYLASYKISGIDAGGRRQARVPRPLRRKSLQSLQRFFPPSMFPRNSTFPDGTLIASTFLDLCIIYDHGP